jgi:ankyrin repeat protein
MIIPGSSDSSRLIRRVMGSEFGTRMPLSGALPPEEIETLRRWIDEGAEWPDALANESPAPVPDQAAIRLSDAIRARDSDRVGSLIAGNPQAINARGHGGTTPLMYAALYGDPGLLRRMLTAGGDPNISNDAGATAVMWALDDVEKVRLLLERGANANVRSLHNQTPLLLAAAQIRSEPVVRLLLQRGATGAQADLTAAASRGNLGVVRALLAAGVRDSGQATTAAMRNSCLDCVEAIAAAQTMPPLPTALVDLLPPGNGSAFAIRAAIERGADVNARDRQLRPVLIKAVLADSLPPDVIQLLVDRGADVHATTADGETVLDFARRAGHPIVIDILLTAGAAPANPVARPAPEFVRGNSGSAAVRRSLPLLQRSAVEFYRKSGCVSCHHNALTAMTVAAARAKNIPVDEALARLERDTVAKDAASAHDLSLQGLVRFGGGPPTIGYVLMGLAAEGYQRDLATDAMVRLLRLSQLDDGRWQGAYRPPHESSEFTYTAVNMRGIQRYGSGPSCGACEQAVQRAAAWLTNAHPQNTEDRVFRLFGLTWARVAAPAVRAAMDDLVARQRPDGGWAQLATLTSDAYATGSALVALHEAGMRVADPVYVRGLRPMAPVGAPCFSNGPLYGPFQGWVSQF